MKSKEDIIREILQEIRRDLVLTVPTVKRGTASISIEDVAPAELSTFMKENNVPEDAEFSVKTDYDREYGTPILEWEVDIPRTREEISRIKSRKFEDIAFPVLSRAMSEDGGYKRVFPGFDFVDKAMCLPLHSMSIEDLVIHYAHYWRKVD